RSFNKDGSLNSGLMSKYRSGGNVARAASGIGDSFDACRNRSLSARTCRMVSMYGRSSMTGPDVQADRNTIAPNTHRDHKGRREITRIVLGKPKTPWWSPCFLGVLCVCLRRVRRITRVLRTDTRPS